MFKILGAKNRRKKLHKHPGPPFQIRPGPGCFSIAGKCINRSMPERIYSQEIAYSVKICIS